MIRYQSWFDRRFVWCVDTAVSPASQPRLKRAALGRAEPSRIEIVLAHQLKAAAQLGCLVAVERDVNGTQLEEASLGPAGGGELSGELRP